MQEAVPLRVAPHAERLEDPEPTVGGGASTDPDRDLLDPGVDHRAKHLPGTEGRGTRRVPLLGRQARQPRGLGELDDRPAAVARAQPTGAYRAVDRVGGRDLLPLPAAGRLHGHERALPAVREGDSSIVSEGRARRQPSAIAHATATDVSDPLNELGAIRTVRSPRVHRRSFQKNVAAHGCPSGFSA